MRALGLKSCLPRAPKLNHPLASIVLWLSNLNISPTSSFNELNPYMVDATISILQMLALHRWRLLSSFTQILQPKMPEKVCFADPSPFMSLSTKASRERGLQMMCTHACWHSSFLIQTPSSATQPWHSAYAAISGIQTTTTFSASQLPFVEGSRILRPAEKLAGEGCTFPRGQMVMDCHHEAVYLATLGKFSSPAGRRDLILQVH